MRKLLITLLLPIVILMIFCSFKNQHYYRLYVHTNSVYNEYISLKTNLFITKDKFYDYYTDRGNGTIIGTWELRGDTVILTPNIEAAFMGDRVIDITIPQDLPDTLRNNLTIQKKFLIKNEGKQIVDVTDYSTLWPEDDIPPKIYYTTFDLVFED